MEQPKIDYLKTNADSMKNNAGKNGALSKKQQ